MRLMKWMVDAVTNPSASILEIALIIFNIQSLVNLLLTGFVTLLKLIFITLTACRSVSATAVSQRKISGSIVM